MKLSLHHDIQLQFKVQKFGNETEISTRIGRKWEIEI